MFKRIQIGQGDAEKVVYAASYERREAPRVWVKVVKNDYDRYKEPVVLRLGIF